MRISDIRKNVQTVLVIYTTSSYNWVTNVRRRLANQTYLSGGYGGAHSGLSQSAGFSSSSERASGALTWRTFNLNGYYSKADGTLAIFTANPGWLRSRRTCRPRCSARTR